MPRLAFFFALVLLAGCCSLDLAPTPQAPPPPQLQLTGRGVVDPDLSSLPSRPEKSPPARPTQYHRLTAAECRYQALLHAPLAADLDAHPDNSPTCFLFKQSPDSAQMSRLMRGYAADEIRNRSASEALELYYKLLAAEGQYDLLLTAHGIVRVQFIAAEKAVKGGGDDRADADKLRRQLLNLESQLAKLEASIDALNAGLAGYIGIDPADAIPIWPADPLRVTGESVDVEPAVQTAMRYRPDLNLLRILAKYDDPGGELVKSVLTSVNPLLGIQDATNPIVVMLAAIKKNPTKWESKTKQQVAGVLASRERQASAEVRAGAATVRGSRLSVAAKAAEVKNLTDKVADLQKRAVAGVAGAEVEYTLARLDLLKLRAELIQASADWEIAEVKLRQATGMLVRE